MPKPPTRCWGDDDDEDGERDGAPTTNPVMSSPTQNVPVLHLRYPIRYHRHDSYYQPRLLSVSGRPLVDDKGEPLNVWRADFKDYLESKQVVAVQRVYDRKGWMYFVTSPEERADFIEALKLGTMIHTTPYHVYLDEPNTPLPYDD